MSHRTAAWLAWSLCAAVLTLIALSLLLIVLGWSTPLPKAWISWGDQALSLVGFIGAPLLGGLIASRRPENPYGWLWIGFGMGFALTAFANAYSAYALMVAPGSLPAPRMVGVLGTEGFVLWITLLPFLFLLFPDGRLPSQRWRYLAWSVVAVGAMMVALGPLLSDPTTDRFVNPIAIGGTAGEVIDVLGYGGMFALFGAVILSALSLVFRHRRAVGVERQQIKWFVYAATFVGGFTVLSFFLPDWLTTLLGTAVGLGLYASVGVAILKYRLYDIDVVRKTLDAFSAKLRDETDLDTLNNHLVEVVRETMQPAHASLWLRPDTTSKGEPAE